MLVKKETLNAIMAPGAETVAKPKTGAPQANCRRRPFLWHHCYHCSDNGLAALRDGERIGVEIAQEKANRHIVHRSRKRENCTSSNTIHGERQGYREKYLALVRSKRQRCLTKSFADSGKTNQGHSDREGKW
nr:hypothetical protein [Bradyrhizobium sp. CCBAU 11430]